MAPGKEGVRKSTAMLKLLLVLSFALGASVFADEDHLIDRLTRTRTIFSAPIEKLLGPSHKPVRPTAGEQIKQDVFKKHIATCSEKAYECAAKCMNIASDATDWKLHQECGASAKASRESETERAKFDECSDKWIRAGEMAIDHCYRVACQNTCNTCVDVGIGRKVNRPEDYPVCFKPEKLSAWNCCGFDKPTGHRKWEESLRNGPWVGSTSPTGKALEQYSQQRKNAVIMAGLRPFLVKVFGSEAVSKAEE